MNLALSGVIHKLKRMDPKDSQKIPVEYNEFLEANYGSNALFKLDIKPTHILKITKFIISEEGVTLNDSFLDYGTALKDFFIPFENSKHPRNLDLNAAFNISLAQMKYLTIPLTM